jgi:predicted RNase H-like HicB family nuclease
MNLSPFRDGTDAVAMKWKFLVVYEVGADNLSGFLPDVPGVISTAATLEQMRQVMREAVEFHLEALVADGDRVPEPATTSVDFAEEDPDHGVLSCIVEWLEVRVPHYHAVA